MVCVSGEMVPRKVCRGREDEWNLRLSESVFKYNTKAHSATAAPPFKITFRQECTIGVRSFLGEIGNEDEFCGVTENASQQCESGVAERISQTELK